MDYLKRIIGELGWTTRGHGCMIDEDGKEHDVGAWYDMIGRGVQRARPVLWMRAADKR